MTALSWLSRSLRSFLYSSSVYSSQPLTLLLLLGLYHFCLLLCPSLHEMFLGISNFLEEISSLSHSAVFLYFIGLITEEGFLFSPCYCLELCIQMGICFFLLCFSLLFFSQLFIRPPQTIIWPFCISFPLGWSSSLSPVQCHEPLSIFLEALCLSDLIP